MTQCDRCGEQNHDDARYCGTCGLGMPTDDGIESLVADDAAPDDDTTPGQGPGVAGLQTSEYVRAPTFGETGPVAAPAPPPAQVGSVAPPPRTTVIPAVGAPPHGAVPVPVVRSARSASIMIASLAVAAVVIVGGVFILLTSGQGGPETARTGDGQTAPTEPIATPVAVTASSVASTTEPPPTVTAPPSTEPPASVVPAEPAVTLPPESTTAPTIALPVPPPPTAPPLPVPTAPPAPASTAAPTPTPPPTVPPAPPPRAPGDLGLTQPILDESCDGRYITFVGSAIGDRPYNSVVGELLDIYPGTNYIWTKACPSLRQEFTNGDDIYGVVFGPFATRQQACNARDFGPSDAYVRRISTFDPPSHSISC